MPCLGGCQLHILKRILNLSLWGGLVGPPDLFAAYLDPGGVLAGARSGLVCGQPQSHNGRNGNAH